MLTVRRSDERGRADHGWLKSRHTFSFAEYFDRAHMHFGPLRVINEDWIQGGQGFGSHPHRDMEIITYIVDGALEHRDSMGNQSVIKPGEVQHMSAGTGVVHSELNPLPDQETHLLQIWILPDQPGIKPRYGQKDFSGRMATEPIVLVASKSGRDGSIPISQDADVFVCKAAGGETRRFAIRPHRGLWLQIVKGELVVEGTTLRDGDAVAAQDQAGIDFTLKTPTELLLFDLPLA